MKTLATLTAIFISVLTSTSSVLATDCLFGDCYNGYGIQTTYNGFQYIGEFKNGKKNGQGLFYYSNELKYVGSWRNDIRHGEGRMYDNDKITQSGIWENNVLIVRQAITGCISGNCLNGFGTYLYEDGKKLYAQFANGEAISQVICYYPNGEKYVGKWKNHDRTVGMLYSINKEVIKAIWKDGKYIGSLKGEKVGCVSGNCVNGKGSYVYADLTRYDGSFKNGLANGYGICYYADGDIYVGDWENHTFDGIGTMYFNDGSVVQGNWKNGNYIKKEVVESIEAEYRQFDFTEGSNENGKIWIVLVGVSRYTTMQSLKYTDDDAYKLHSFFKSPQGGAIPDNQIKLLIDEDATKDNILKNLREAAANAEENDLVLFFFSGHGINGSFLPSDYDGRYQVVEHQDVLNIMENSKAKSKVVIADACHAGSFNTKGANYETTLNSFYSAFNNSRGGTLLMLSSKAEETSIESNGLRQGVFSHYLINGLKGSANTNSDQLITVKEVFDYVHSNVRNFTNNRQTPVIRGNFDENMPLGTVPF